ncbi:hypothetical protein J2W46_003107 [Paraburkholderia strydomiana]|nr:hypothetical protein [Paraburkholderia strydomiana]
MSEIFGVRPLKITLKRRLLRAKRSFKGTRVRVVPAARVVILE